MPVIERLHINFRCLRDVEMDFTSPEDGAASPFIALVGPNGAGKTTVLESIALAVVQVLNHHLSHLKRGWQPDSSIQIHFKDGRIEWPGGGQIPPEFGAQLRKILSIPSGYLPSIPSGKPLSSGNQNGLGPHGLELPIAFSTSGQRVALVHQWWLRQHMQYPGTTNLDRLWKALEPFLGDLTYLGVNSADHLPMFDARGTSVSFNELSSGERRIILLFLDKHPRKTACAFSRWRASSVVLVRTRSMSCAPAPRFHAMHPPRAGAVARRIMCCRLA